jgi:[ribosomal protein S5]-alanine N-acetyltransferase
MNLKFNENIFKNFPELESERLIFRPLNKKDTEQLYLIRSNELVMKYMDAIMINNMKAASVMISFFKYEFKHKNAITWGIVEKQTNKLIGTFAFWRLLKQHCRAEIGYSLTPKYWGNGLMTEAFKTLIEYGFKSMNLHSIEANVNPKNENSIKLLERIGFKKEAYFRENFKYQDKFIDSAIYCLIETDVRKY